VCLVAPPRPGTFDLDLGAAGPGVGRVGVAGGRAGAGAPRDGRGDEAGGAAGAVPA
jgi:hypothetical protein